MGAILDEDNNFISGRFEGETLEDVADAEPEYLHHLLTSDEVYIDAEERAAIEQALGIAEAA